MELPSVAVLLPTFNEEAFIDACLESLAAQDYAGQWAVVIADGGSTDATRRLAEAWRDRVDVTVVDNPARVQSEGLWLAAQHTDADTLVRADAHTTYAPDYVRRCVEVLAETGATAVGGPMVPEAPNRFGRSVARVMRTPLGVGPGAFHHGGVQRAVDTVYLGAFRRDGFMALGGMRTMPSGVAEDADFYWRMRRNGGTVLLDPTIRSTYRPRETWPALWRQFLRYGQGKADMLFVNGVWPSWRPLAPLGLTLGLIGGLVAGLLGSWWPLAALVVVWFASLLMATQGNLLDVLVAATMHVSYGVGLLLGLFRWPGAVRSQVVSRSP
ncbi:MAG TPA: glycosyltransferase family 2 protein [Acidimicrobiia bacterium]|nr:glycosyltransferase family 2 protein [Acidimicrobiia bacterium]